MEQAIKKAIEGGYDSSLVYNREIVLLNPLFWRALSKSENWGTTKLNWSDGDLSSYGVHYFGGKFTYPYNEGADVEFEIDTWRLQMHYFIDHIAEGKDIDSFFNELLK